MRRATSREAQLDLPGLAAPTLEPAVLPEPRRAALCARCGWYRELAATCPVCQHRSPPSDPR